MRLPRRLRRLAMTGVIATGGKPPSWVAVTSLSFSPLHRARAQILNTGLSLPFAVKTKVRLARSLPLFLPFSLPLAVAFQAEFLIIVVFFLYRKARCFL